MKSNILRLNAFVYRYHSGKLERCPIINNGVFDEEWETVDLSSLPILEQKEIKDFFGLN